MKFKLVEKLIEEAFTSPESLERHYIEHAIKDGYYKNLTQEEYEELADTLANAPVDMFRIRGYKTADDKGRVRYVKWDRDTYDFVVYGREYEGQEPQIITLYKVSPRQYSYREDKYSNGEVPYGL